jgi:hypothetical protein
MVVAVLDMQGEGKNSVVGDGDRVPDGKYHGRP